MPAMEPLYRLIGVSRCDFSKEEFLILEAELFICICEELKEFFRNQYRNYFCLMKFAIEHEDDMLEINFIRLIMKDILSSEEYTLEGIARYTDTHEDVVQEIFAGSNISPSARLFRRVIELHRSIRSDLYGEIMKRVAAQYLIVA